MTKKGTPRPGRSRGIIVFTFIWYFLLNSSGQGAAEASERVKGFNLTEDETFPLEANLTGPKTEAQKAVDHIKRLGGNHVILNPRAIMLGPYLNEIIPLTPPEQRNKERSNYLALIKYIHSQKMTVGIRPIFFVVKDRASLKPFEETKVVNGVVQKKMWWHGNIQPSNPDRWFDSFKSFLDLYLIIAKLGGAEEFTIGAELYSMTVGIEDQWAAHPHGFPGRWVKLLNYARAKLPSGTRIMYDINFTDDIVTSAGGLTASGGELERWRYRLVDLAAKEERNERNEWWYDLVDFWKGLDAIGIDMYRSLAGKNDVIPTGVDELVSLLQVRTDDYAGQLDTAVLEIENTLNHSKKFMFKEIGYRSAMKGFIDPFVYDNRTDVLNVLHQSASYQAFFNSFWKPDFSWFGGVSFWDVSTNPKRSLPADTGFAPVNKKETEEVIMTHFKG